MITLGFDPWVQERVDWIQRSWDDYTRYRREHDIRSGQSLEGLARFLFEASSRATVLPPRHRDRRRKPAHSSAGGGYDQRDLFFDHLLYVWDHEPCEMMPTGGD